MGKRNCRHQVGPLEVGVETRPEEVDELIDSNEVAFHTYALMASGIAIVTHSSARTDSLTRRSMIRSASCAAPVESPSMNLAGSQRQ